MKYDSLFFECENKRKFEMIDMMDGAAEKAFDSTLSELI